MTPAALGEILDHLKRHDLVLRVAKISDAEITFMPASAENCKAITPATDVTRGRRAT